jgi:copper(I)-binding protein
MMGPVGPVDLPPGSAAQLDPGGLHVMLVGVRRSLAASDTVRLALLFDCRGELEVTAEVRPF